MFSVHWSDSVDALLHANAGYIWQEPVWHCYFRCRTHIWARGGGRARPCRLQCVHLSFVACRVPKAACKHCRRTAFWRNRREQLIGVVIGGRIEFNRVGAVEVCARIGNEQWCLRATPAMDVTSGTRVCIEPIGVLQLNNTCRHGSELERRRALRAHIASMSSDRGADERANQMKALIHE
jgi:hypothetical protein